MRVSKTTGSVQIAPPSFRAAGNPGSSVTEFMLIGGWTLIAAVIMGILQLTRLNQNPIVSVHLDHFVYMFPTLALVANYPHATWSYRFAYQQGPRLVQTHYFRLLALPILLLAGLSSAYFLWSRPMSDFPLILGFERVLQKSNIFINASVYPSFGQFLFAQMLIFQQVTVMHHFAMQSYGVALSCGQSAGYQMSVEQRNLLRYNLHSLWVASLFSGYTVFSALNNMSFHYFSPRFPRILLWGSGAVFLATFVMIITKIVIPIHRKTGRWPPLNTVVSVLSLYLWQQTFWWPFGFQLWMVPLAHAIQYLTFVHRVEAGGFRELSKGEENPRLAKKPGPFYFILLTLAVMLLGFLGFEGIPIWLDRLHPSSIMTANFFVIAANILINVHHYFIDGAVWRSPESKVRTLLRTTSLAAA